MSYGVYLVCLTVLSISRIEAEERTEAIRGSIVYDIPSQDLTKAVTAYAAQTGVQVLYEAALTAGRRSGAVKGTLSPDAALQLLLVGSGLIARRTDVDAITITAASPETAAAMLGQIPPDQRFLGALQAGLRTALCRSDETRPGAYRIALQLWFDPNNKIERAVLLGSTGDSRRDAALTSVLHGMAIGTVPPAGMAQPVTLTILPRSPLQGDECAGGRGAASP
ncbi:STN domain-containing protein [Bradyrhizobium sp. ARR65]|uniref:STN domain-containing protein n=1 Tax=Bradyrhizobium sp. ARR65 TaxID=1040989 RepID=UPI0012FC83C7|nr:STN domain-containing protein [Bradyrhizobium sp. ARR65]